MYIYRVIPLISLPRQQIQLPSYFSSEKFETGQLVEVPMRTRKVPAIIITREQAEKKKQNIRKSAFSLRKIERALAKGPILPKKFLKLATRLSDYYFAPAGLMLRRMLPPFFSKPNAPLLKMLSSLSPPPEFSEENNSKKILICGDYKSRNKEYIKYAKEGGALVIVPEFMQISYLENILPTKDLVKIDSSMPRTKWRKAWKDAYEGKIENIIGTRSALFTPFKNMETIILDNENNTSHVSWDMHPKFDARYAAEEISKIYNTNIIEGDLIPSIEKYHQAKNEDWQIIKKSSHLAKCKIIDMKKELEKENVSILSEELQKQIKEVGKKDKMLLFMARRGLSSALVCRDCGYIVNCPDCDTPAILHKGGKLICHRCGKKMPAPDICPSCRGHRIKQLGGGTQLVAEEVVKIAPNIKIKRIDSDTAKTPEEQKEILDEFKNGDINILIGTRSALKDYMLPKIDNAAIVMMDAILHLPEYKASERVFELLWRLKNITSKKVLIQTYHPELSVFTSINENSFENFYNDELKKRQLFKWPPYSQLIKLTYRHKNAATAEQTALTLRQKLETQINNIDIEGKLQITTGKDNKNRAIANVQILGPAPGYTPKINGEYIWYILIKWPKDKKGVIKYLQARNKLLNVVPTDWEINVDPIDITS
ncbi:MAG: primosomal protein N' [Candidatus Spechtbacterales bacterium]|nr:primosomal protein N' [Candidatus Spechtbacterales bacterium]